MNRRTFYSLIPGFVLCLFLLISLPLNDLASLEEMNHPDFTVSDTEDSGQPSQYLLDDLSQNVLVHAFAPVANGVSVELRYRPVSFRSFILFTFAAGFLFKAVLFLPEKERYFACFQASIFCTARFLRDLSIRHRKDGKQRLFAV